MSGSTDILGAIAAIESQRSVLGDAMADAAIAPLRARLTAMDAPQASPSAERKQITVMFADLSGFTALSETADPEDVRNLINACFERIGTVATRFGGYIDKFIGDELMVLFGAPQAMEDHASRALHAALEMQAALEQFNGERALTRRQPLGMHFGINSGMVVAGGMGIEARREYTVIGDAVNVAARLVSRAETGAIYVGDRTRRLVGPGFEFESEGLLELDGRSRPVEVFALKGVVETAQTVRDVRAATMLFGRQRELQTLQETFDDVAKNSRTRSLTVIGPAGIGKSRLLSEFKRWTEAERGDATVLGGAALPHTSTAPYYLVADLLRHWLNVRETDAPADIRTRLESAIAALGIDDPEACDAISMIMAIETIDSPLQAMAPQERREHIAAAAIGLVRRMAQAGPVVLSFEDLHWADDQSIELLEHLFTKLHDSPVLFLTLTRPIGNEESKAIEVELRLPRESHARLVLHELAESDSVELVYALAPGIERFPEVARTIVRKGQGNPFFVEAIVGTLVDQRILLRDAEGMTVNGDIASITVPDTVWGVLAERIDRLPSDEKRVIQMSAIVGRLFWEGLVQELADAAAVGGHLQILRQREFIEPVGPAAFANDWEWMFRHILVQEVAYDGMLRETRRAAHLRAARWLEERVGERRGEYAPLLARHYEVGEDWLKTAHWAEEAADRAAQLFANREARVSYRQAIDALNRVEAEPDIQRRIIDLTLKLAHVSFFTPSEDVHSALESAKELAEVLGDEKRALRVMTATATWLYQAGRARPAIELAIQCIAGATKLNDDELLAVPYTLVGRAMFAMGEYEKCIEMTEKAVSLAEAHGMHLDGMTSLSPNMAYLGMAYSELGEIEKGAQLGRESLALAERANDHRGIATAHLYLGAVNSSFGRLDEAAGHLDLAVEIGQQTGDQSVVWVGMGFLGHWHAQRGELEIAVSYLDRALALAAEVDSFLAIPIILGFRAEADVRRGNFEEAVAFGERGVQVGRESRQQTFEAEAHRALAWALLYARPQGRSRAVEELQAAIEIHRKTNARVLLARALFELSAFVDDDGAAEAVTAEAQRIAEELSLDWLPVPRPAPIATAAAR